MNKTDKEREQMLREAAENEFDKIFEFDECEKYLSWEATEENFELDEMVKKLSINLAKSEAAKQYHHNKVVDLESIRSEFYKSYNDFVNLHGEKPASDTVFNMLISYLSNPTPTKSILKTK